MFEFVMAIIALCAFIVVPFFKNGNKEYVLSTKVYFLLAGAFLFMLIFLKFIAGELIMPWNTVTTQATIISLDNEIKEVYRNDGYFISWIFYRSRAANKSTHYRRGITYSYSVNGIEYIKHDTLESYNRYDVKNISKQTIKVTYNKVKPEIVIIDGNNNQNEKDFINVLTIISFIGLGIIIRMGSIPLKKEYLNQTYSELSKQKLKGKDVTLKVLKIEIIDYEREKVFLENEEKSIYFYETDFGEEFKVDEKYIIKLNRYNQEKEKIEYEGNTIKIIKIINTEKKEFSKVE